MTLCVCLCKDIHMRRFLPSAISHDADLQKQIGQVKEGESIVHFIHTHACTHINQKASEPACAQIAPWCTSSFILCTRIIKHENSQTCCPFYSSSARTRCTQNTHKDEATWNRVGDAMMSEKCWLAASVNRRHLRVKLRVCSLCHISTDLDTHTCSDTYTHTLLLPHSLLAFADQAPVKHAVVAIWSLCESCC